MISLHILSHAKVLIFDTQFHFPWNGPKLHGLIGQKQQNSFQLTHTENFFVIRRAGKQALGLESSFLRILDTFQSFKLLF